MAKEVLYFIGLIPDEVLSARVKSLKEHMRDTYSAGHALKSPAHITLQMPFKYDVAKERRLVEVLLEFAKKQHPFQVQLSGFGCFPPRVIFIGISDHKPIDELHVDLRKVLLNDLGLSRQETAHRFHPHMTIATRDLKEEVFPQAWEEMESMPFEATFIADSLSLLKHNGSHWDIFRTFPYEF